MCKSNKSILLLSSISNKELELSLLKMAVDNIFLSLLSILPSLLKSPYANVPNPLPSILSATEFVLTYFTVVSLLLTTTSLLTVS